jgi:hypothetical protein
LHNFAQICTSDYDDRVKLTGATDEGNRGSLLTGKGESRIAATVWLQNFNKRKEKTT